MELPCTDLEHKGILSIKRKSEAACSGMIQNYKSWLFWESWGEKWSPIAFMAKSISHDLHYYSLWSCRFTCRWELCSSHPVGSPAMAWQSWGCPFAGKRRPFHSHHCNPCFQHECPSWLEMVNSKQVKPKQSHWLVYSFFANLVFGSLRYLG